MEGGGVGGGLGADGGGCGGSGGNGGGAGLFESYGLNGLPVVLFLVLHPLRRDAKNTPGRWLFPLTDEKAAAPSVL